MTELSLPPQPRPPRRREPDERLVVRVYRNDSSDVQVYEHVKHCWWSAGNSVLTILHYYDNGSHRYVNILRERIDWYSVEQEDK